MFNQLKHGKEREEREGGGRRREEGKGEGRIPAQRREFDLMMEDSGNSGRYMNRREEEI